MAVKIDQNEVTRLCSFHRNTSPFDLWLHWKRFYSKMASSQTFATTERTTFIIHLGDPPRLHAHHVPPPRGKPNIRQLSLIEAKSTRFIWFSTEKSGCEFATRCEHDSISYYLLLRSNETTITAMMWYIESSLDRETVFRIVKSRVYKDRLIVLCKRRRNER